MKPVIYIDILFLTNFLMNSVIIYSSSVVLDKHIHIFRLILSAAILAFYASVMFFPQLSVLYSVFFKIIILFLSMTIAFPTKKFKCLIKNSIAFFAINFVFGGVCFALIFFTDFGVTTGAVISNGELYLNISAKSLVFSAVLAYIIIYILSYIRKNIVCREKQITPLHITFEGRIIALRALADTGCLVTAPISGLPVIIISTDAAKQLLPNEFFIAINRNFSDIEDEKYVKIYRIIPYSTIEASGIMNGFVPDSVCLNGQQTHSALIGIAPMPLSQDSAFDAIFNPELLSTSKIFSGGIT